MLNEIIKGISMALNAAFGDGYEIYQNECGTGFERTLFFDCRFTTGNHAHAWAALYQEEPI